MKTIRTTSINRKTCSCPQCGASSKRHSVRASMLAEIGVSCPVALRIVRSVHFCAKCLKYFSAPADHIAPSYGRYTWRVIWRALDYIKRGEGLAKAALSMREKHHVAVPVSTLHEWAREHLG